MEPARIEHLFRSSPYEGLSHVHHRQGQRPVVIVHVSMEQRDLIVVDELSPFEHLEDLAHASHAIHPCLCCS